MHKGDDMDGGRVAASDAWAALRQGHGMGFRNMGAMLLDLDERLTDVCEGGKEGKVGAVVASEEGWEFALRAGESGLPTLWEVRNRGGVDEEWRPGGQARLLLELLEEARRVRIELRALRDDLKLRVSLLGR